MRQLKRFIPLLVAVSILFGLFGRNGSTPVVLAAAGFNCSTSNRAGNVTPVESSRRVARPHKPGYTAPVAPTYQGNVPNPDPNSREREITANLSEEPIPANSSLVDLDYLVTAFTSSSSQPQFGDHIINQVHAASELNSTGQYVMKNPVDQVKYNANNRVFESGFSVAVADVAGDERKEEILVYRRTPTEAVRIQIEGKPENGSTFLSDVSAIADGGDEFFFANGYDGGLWIGDRAAGSGDIAWERCGEGQASGYAVGLTSSGLRLLATDEEGNLQVRDESSAEWLLVNMPTGGIKFSGTPALIVNGDATQTIFATATDGTVWTSNSAGGFGVNWQSLGGFAVGSPAAIAYDNVKLALAIRSFDNALWTRIFDGSVWGDWQAVPNSNDLTLTSSPTLYSESGSAFDVYARGSDNSLLKLPVSNGAFGVWSTTTVSESVGSRPAVIDGVTEPKVFTLSADNNTVQAQNGNGWASVTSDLPGTAAHFTDLEGFAFDDRYDIPEVLVETGYFLGNGREQIVVGVLNSSYKLELHVYDVRDGYGLEKVTSLQLPESVWNDLKLNNVLLWGSLDFDITTGDFNGDGQDEIATFAVNPNVLVGSSYHQAIIHVVEFDASTNTLESKGTIPVGYSSSTEPTVTRVALAAGDFNGEGKEDLAIAWVQQQYPFWLRTTRKVLTVNANTFTMGPQQEGTFTRTNYHWVVKPPLDIATGDVTGATGGPRMDEVMILRPHVTGSGGYQFTVDAAEIDAGNSYAFCDRTDSSWNMLGGTPAALAVGDMDRDLEDEVAVLAWLDGDRKRAFTFEVDVLSANSNCTSSSNPPRLSLRNTSQTYLTGVAPTHGNRNVDIAVGDLSGKSLRVGKPSYRLQTDVGNIIAIVNAPPRHNETVNGTTLAIGDSENTFAGYATSQSSSSTVKVETTRSYSLDTEATATIGNESESHVKTSIGASYGSDFGSANANYTTYETSSSFKARQNDFALFTGTTYQIWEYPLYDDQASEPKSHMTVVFPVSGTEVPYTGGQSGCDGWYQPTHEVGNIWSYPDLNRPQDFTGYTGGSLINSSNAVAVAGGETVWEYEVVDGQSAELMQGVKSGVTAGLQTQIGGETVDVSIDLPFVSVSKSVTLPSLKATLNSSYSSSNLSTYNVETQNQLKLETHYDGVVGGGGNDSEQFQYRAFLYWATGGYLVLDHTTRPAASSGVWGALYGGLPDPAFRRPYADGICTLPGQEERIFFSPEISIDPPYAKQGETVTVEAMMHNYSATPVSGVVVRFYLGDPDNGGTLIGDATTTVNFNRIDGASKASISFEATGRGEQHVYAVIDPDGIVNEVHDESSNTNNNKAYNVLNVAATAFIDPGAAETSDEDEVTGPPPLGAIGIRPSAPSFGRDTADTSGDLDVNAYISLSSNVFTQTLQFELVELDSADSATPVAPSTGDIVGAIFELKAYEAAAEKALAWGNGVAPSVVTIAYDAGLVDANLQVLRWDSAASSRGLRAGAWVDASCNGVDVIQLTDENRFVVPVCATGEFVVVNSSSVPTQVALVAGSASAPAATVLLLAMFGVVLSMTALVMTRFRPNK